MSGNIFGQILTAILSLKTAPDTISTTLTTVQTDIATMQDDIALIKANSAFPIASTLYSFASADLPHTAEAALQLTATTGKGIAIIKAHKDNTGSVNVGLSNVAVTNYKLFAGESITLGVDNVAALYLYASADTQKADWIIMWV